MDADWSQAASRFERLEAAARHAAEAQAFAVQVLASSVAASRRAAEAHEGAASAHDKAAASGIGDVLAHEQQATSHRMAAAADRQRAERAQSLISESEYAGPAAVGGEPGDGVAPSGIGPTGRTGPVAALVRLAGGGTSW